MHIPLQIICDIYFKLIRNICYRPSLTWATFEHALNKHIVVWAWWLPFFSLTFSYKLSLENVFWLVCHWRLLLRIQLTMNQHWFEVMAQHWIVNTLRPRQNGRHFTDDTFKRISVNENVRISIKFSLKFILKCPINNIPALVLIMAWRRPGDKPLFEPVMVSLLTHICVTWPWWGNKSLPGSLMIHSSHYQNHWWSTQVITRIIDDLLKSLPESLMIHSSHYQNHWWSTPMIADALELCLSCTNPSKWPDWVNYVYIPGWVPLSSHLLLVLHNGKGSQTGLASVYTQPGTHD